MLKHDLETVGVGSKYDELVELVSNDGEYKLIIHKPILTRDTSVVMEITPKMILEWSRQANGDYFKAYNKEMSKRFKEELHKDR